MSPILTHILTLEVGFILGVFVLQRLQAVEKESKPVQEEKKEWVVEWKCLRTGRKGQGTFLHTYKECVDECTIQNAAHGSFKHTTPKRIKENTES